MSAFAPSLPSAGAVTEVCSGSDSSGLSLLTGTAGDIAAGPSQRGDKAERHRVVIDRQHDDRDR